MILTHESGAQEDQFDEKKWRPKISWYYPFKFIMSTLHTLCTCGKINIKMWTISPILYQGWSLCLVSLSLRLK
jgi:hypothetical protein